MDIDCFTKIITEYHQEIKGSLFVTGFTLGSFLFSMKSLIIKTMKEEIYDQEDYQKDIDDIRDTGEKITYYESLQDFSTLLYRSITFCFVSAILNISLGIIDTFVAATICLIFTLIAWFYIGKSLYFFQSNWAKVFEYAENKAKANRKSKRDEE